MPWGAVAGAVASYGLNQLNKPSSASSSLGAGTTQDTKAPWAAAQPWLTQNLQQGQALQNQYAAQPFSAQQQQAYNNQYAQSDYMRSLVPSLLNQMQGQPGGFDISNPTATKQNAWNWNTGLLGSDAAGGAQGSMTTAQAAQAAADAAAKTKKPSGDFTQQGAVSWNPFAGNPDSTAIKSQFTGGYGDFKYGDQPKAGTQAYRDMMEYVSYGGADPLNIYSWNQAAPGGLMSTPNAGGS